MMAWVSVVGLFLDILGFLILAYEWQEAAIQAQAGEVDASLNRGQWGLSPEEQTAMRPGIMSEVAARYWSRKWLFRLGAALIVFGFLFQLIGSWPKG
jgi:hypothetical protein